MPSSFSIRFNALAISHRERERGVSSSLRQRVAERERNGRVGLLIKFKLELCLHFFGLGLVTVKILNFCFTVGMTWMSRGVLNLVEPPRARGSFKKT